MRCLHCGPMPIFVSAHSLNCMCLNGFSFSARSVCLKFPIRLTWLLAQVNGTKYLPNQLPSIYIQANQRSCRRPRVRLIYRNTANQRRKEKYIPEYWKMQLWIWRILATTHTYRLISFMCHYKCICIGYIYAWECISPLYRNHILMLWFSYSNTIMKLLQHRKQCFFFCPI